MQAKANTTIIPVVSAAIRSLLPSPSSEWFTISIPGEEPVGKYETIEDAETSLQFLPFSVRQRAFICDADGRCLIR